MLDWLIDPVKNHKKYPFLCLNLFFYMQKVHKKSFFGHPLCHLWLIWFLSHKYNIQCIQIKTMIKKPGNHHFRWLKTVNIHALLLACGNRIQSASHQTMKPPIIALANLKVLPINLGRKAFFNAREITKSNSEKLKFVQFIFSGKTGGTWLTMFS